VIERKRNKIGMNEREILYKVMFVGIREKVGGKEGFEKF